MCFREGSKMDIEELYRCVFNNVSKNQYDKAFEIALSAYQSYTLNELDEFFRKSPPVYNMVGISGSGGSNIAKPNIGTLTAYHLAKIFQVENFNISIVKFGSRKRTSVSGSVDFGETINSIPFKLVDDSCFNKTISYLTFNESIHKYIDEHYVVSIPTSKRLVFCKSKVEADHIMMRDSNNIEVEVIYSCLNGKPFDEIIPEHYVICHENGTVSKSFPKYTDKDYEITSSDVTDLNQRLLNSKDFSEPWGRCLKYSIAEAISFFCDKKIEDAFDIIHKYSEHT